MFEPGAYVEYNHLWPKSERLEKSLQSGRYDYVYTMPGVKVHQPLIDKMVYAASQLTDRPLIRPTVACDINGLMCLIKSGNLKSAFNLTTSLLEMYGQGYGKAGQPTKNSLETFMLWSCRFQLMMALRLHSSLIEEISPFEELDAPDAYFDYYPEYRSLGYTGSIVPFSMRLVHAEILRFTPEPWSSMKRILKLENDTRKIIDSLSTLDRPNNEKSLWSQRMNCVLMLKARNLYFLKEYHSSMSLFYSISSNLDSERKNSLLYMLFRLAISIGDEKSGEKYLKDLKPGSGLDYTLYKALKAIFHGNYSYAQDQLQSVKKNSQENAKLCNNEAIALLYNGRIEESKNLLLAYSGLPPEAILINMGTISELVSTSSEDLKKQLFSKNCDKMIDIYDPQAIKLTI